MRRNRLLLLVEAAMLVSGCGGDIGGGDGVIDSAPPPPPVADSAPIVVADAEPPGPDAATVACPASLPEDFGDLGAQATNKNDIGGSFNVFIDINGNPDLFFIIKAIPGRGVFAGGVVPGTYDLVAAEIDYQYCAACLFMFASYGTGPESVHMMAQKGTLVIDSVAGAEISGSIQDLLLSAIQIVYDDEGVSCGDIEDEICVNTICLNETCGRQVPLLGCQTSIDSLQF